MKQKLALIGAFLHSPKLLVLDEPFVGLDPEAAFHLKEFMRELCNQGSAIFFSTHVLEVAEKLCDKVSIIKQGKMVVSGSMENVRGSDSLENVFMEVVENENKYLLLLKMQFFNFLGINRLRYSSNKREIRRSFIIGFSWLLVIVLLITYSAIISIGFVKAGAIDILPIVSTLICSIITLVLTFLKSTGVLFGLRDYDMIMSLPVKRVT